MHIKKITSLVVMLFIFVATLSLGAKHPVLALDYTILPNGNWSFNYESQLDESYYMSLSGLTGASFINELNEIISTNTVKFTYGSKSGETGDKLKYVDESPRNSNNVLMIYSGNDAAKSSLNSVWNQEHTWAKSHGFPEGSKYQNGAAYSDLHHLRPSIMNINSSRGNLDFGEVENYSGTIKTEGLYGSKIISNVIFEPRDAVKGDVARIMMYMDVRYAAKNTNEPNLTLTNKTKTSGTSGEGEFGNLSTLLKWHNEDPVDDVERRRNDRIFEIQKNRNPFIDHPEFIEQVYGVAFTGEGGGTIPEPDPQYDQNRANLVITAINSIGNVTLDSGDAIDYAIGAYNSLTNAQKALVTNYQVLLDAIDEYDRLVGDIVSTTAYEGDFTADLGLSVSYTNNLEVTVDSYLWSMTCGYKKGTDFRLGSNATATIPDKFSSFSSFSDGHALVMEWDILNATAINFSFNGKFDTISEMIIVYSTDGGASYTQAAKVEGYQDSLGATIAPSGNTRFALLIFGSKPRLLVTTVSISVSAEVSWADKIISAINNLVVGLDYSTQNAITKIQNDYDALTEEDRLLVTNYGSFLAKLDEFNDLIENRASELDNEITNVYNALQANPFASEVLEDADYLIAEYYNEIPFVIEALNNTGQFNALSDLYADVMYYLDLVEGVIESEYNITLIENYFTYYESSPIKDYIDSNATYQAFNTTLDGYLNAYLFTQCEIKASLMFVYFPDELTISEGSLAIRIGMVIAKDIYDGLIAFDPNCQFIIIVNDVEVELTPVCVAYEGASVASLDGSLYQFSLVIEEIPSSDANTSLYAKMGISVLGETFYTDEVEKSVVSVANDYLASIDPTIDPYREILAVIASWQ